MIGDSFEADIQGSLSVGMNAIHYVNFVKKNNKDCVIVNNLLSIKKITQARLSLNSERKIPAATETFSDDNLPCNGILIFSSQIFNIDLFIPLPSEPKIIAVFDLKLYLYKFFDALSSDPIISTPNSFKKKIASFM